MKRYVMRASSLKGTPFLKGKNMFLRPLRRQDAFGPYAEWFNDEVVCAGNGHHRFPYSREQALRYIERSHSNGTELILAIARRRDGRHIGNVALKSIDPISRCGEFAIVIGDRSSWGRGYSKEAAILLLRHVFFSLNLNRVYCGTYENNVAMRRLARFLGMREEGCRRQAAFKQNRYLNVIEYGVLKNEFVRRFGKGTQEPA